MKYKANEIHEQLMRDECFWHWPTGHVIFHDPVYDEPPAREDSSTYCITKLDLDELSDDVWDGYHSDEDEDIERNEAVELIMNTNCWVKTGEMDSVYIALAKASQSTQEEFDIIQYA